MTAPDAGLVERFSSELTALTGRVHVAADSADAGRIAARLALEQRARRVLAWRDDTLACPDTLSALREAGIELVEPGLPADPEGRSTLLRDLGELSVGLTGAVAGLADTGSIVVASGPGRARLASLLPPVHIALLPVSRLYPSLRDYLAAEGQRLPQSSNVVIITGPSRTADIEMTLTYGVHGPRQIHVILVNGSVNGAWNGVGTNSPTYSSV